MKRFIDCIFPAKACNLRCHYCYITHTGSFGEKLPVFPYSADHIGRALTVERLGGVCHMNICGEGETLLPPEMTGIVQAILKNGHYVMVVTNGTLKARFDEIVTWPTDILSRLGFKFSYHYLEFKRRGLLHTFFDNVKKVRAAGCSFSVELTPSDEMIPHIDDAMSLCREQVGAVCHVTVARNEADPSLPILTNLSKEDYMATWGKFKSNLFDYKMSVFGVKRREFCYAGEWSAFLNILTGDLAQCYKGRMLQNIYKDVNQPITFLPVGAHCAEEHCYNAHAYLTLGVIPTLQAPPYASLRNRLCADGSEWLTPAMKEFLSRRLGDFNQEIGPWKTLQAEMRQLPWQVFRQMKKIRSKLIQQARRL